MGVVRTIWNFKVTDTHPSGMLAFIKGAYRGGCITLALNRRAVVNARNINS